MTNHNQSNMTNQDAAANTPASFVYPIPQNDSFLGKIGAFAIGFVAGVITISTVIADNILSKTRKDG